MVAVMATTRKEVKAKVARKADQKGVNQDPSQKARVVTHKHHHYHLGDVLTDLPELLLLPEEDPHQFASVVERKVISVQIVPMHPQQNDKMWS